MKLTKRDRKILVARLLKTVDQNKLQYLMMVLDQYRSLETMNESGEAYQNLARFINDELYDKARSSYELIGYIFAPEEYPIGTIVNTLIYDYGNNYNKLYLIMYTDNKVIDSIKV